MRNGSPDTMIRQTRRLLQALASALVLSCAPTVVASQDVEAPAPINWAAPVVFYGGLNVGDELSSDYAKRHGGVEANPLFIHSSSGAAWAIKGGATLAQTLVDAKLQSYGRRGRPWLWVLRGFTGGMYGVLIFHNMHPGAVFPGNGRK